MPVDCHFPITLRIVGSPTDAQLVAAGQTLARAVTARLGEAERTLADQVGHGHGGVEISEAYDPRRDTAGGYAVPSFDGHGRPVAVPLRGAGRGWIVLRNVGFPAGIGDFLDVVRSEREDGELAERVLYLDLWSQQRWVEVWLVRAQRDYDLVELSDELTTRAGELVRLPADQTMATVVSPEDRLRDRLIELDPSGALAPAVPSLATNNVRRVQGAGSRATIRRGGWVVFAFMRVPKVELAQLVELGPSAQVSVPLRDAALFVVADEFEHAYGVSWAAYAAEFGAEPVLVWLQSATVRRRTPAAALDLLLDRELAPRVTSARGGQLGRTDVVSRRLMPLTSATVDRLPGAARDVVAGWNFSSAAGRPAQSSASASPNDHDPFEHAPVGARLLYALALLTVDDERLGTARFRPAARIRAAELNRWLELDPTELAWPYQFESFLNDAFGVPPTVRPPGGTLFEHVLGELSPAELDRLFRNVGAGDLFTLRQRLLLLCRATRFASDGRVVEFERALTETVESGRRNLYWTSPAEIWLDRDPGAVVGVGMTLGDVQSIYITSSERKQLRPARADALRAALIQERERLIEAILRRQDTTTYDQESFVQTVLARAVARIRLTNEDFEDVTIQRSMRLRAVHEEVVDAVRQVRVEFEFVERVDRAPWTAVGDVVNETSGAFEARLVYWCLGRAGEVYAAAGMIISGIGLVAVAWEVGIVAALVDLAGGGAVVGWSMGISVGIYVLRVVFGDAHLSLRGFLEAALQGYLFALGFRAGAVLGTGLARAIGVDTLSRAVTSWILGRLVTGVVGGGVSAGLDLFAQDVLRVALDGGHWSGIRAYVVSITFGAALGVVGEFALTPALNAALGAGREALGTAGEVAARLHAAGWSAAELVSVSTAALSKLRAAVSQFAGEAAAQGFADALAGRVAEIATELGGRELARHVLELTGAPLTSGAAAGLTRLLRALDATGPDRAYAVTRVLAAHPESAVRFLEVVGTLDATAVRRLVTGRFGLSAEQSTFLDALAGSAPDQQRAALDLVTELRTPAEAARRPGPPQSSGAGAGGTAPAPSRAFGFAVVDGADGLRVGVRYTERAYAFNTPVDAEAVRKLLTEIEASHPGSAVYVGSGGHGGEYGAYFASHPDMIESDFLTEDMESMAQLQEIGVGRVLDLSEGANLDIFRRAEAMARVPGQDDVFTIRAWCFSSRSRL